MQAMAPGNRVALQEGQVVGAANGGRAIGAGVGRGGAVGDEKERPAGRPTPAGMAAAAATGCRAGEVPIEIAFLQPGQITCFPAATSGTCMGCVQKGQRINCGI
jgi:hypothetical protein